MPSNKRTENGPSLLDLTAHDQEEFWTYVGTMMCMRCTFMNSTDAYTCPACGFSVVWACKEYESFKTKYIQPILQEYEEREIWRKKIEKCFYDPLMAQHIQGDLRSLRLKYLDRSWL